MVRQRYNVERMLSKFFRDPKGMREQMRSYGVIVSGGQVLQFLDGSHWEESDLDFYVPNTAVEEITNYLCSREEYEVDESEEVDDYEMMDVEVSWCLTVGKLR
jgi:hypothetical protein